MMKLALLFLLPALLFTSCTSQLTPSDKELTVAYTLDAHLRKEDSTKTGGYNLTFKMKDIYFDTDATIFNKDIALLSNGKALIADTEANIRNFYSTLEFDNVYLNYPEHTEDTIQYAIGHKKIGQFDLVSIAINGFEYGLEWKNNALLGKEGDHAGFSARANDIYNKLKDYLKSYTNYKLWISGYSRAGAISNVLSHYILSRNDFNIAQKDMFVYTFEAPKGLLKENAIKYPNVFNITYSGDTVTYIAPAEYGFARCGIDIDVYQSTAHTNAVISNFDEDLFLPEFKPCVDFTDPTGTKMLNKESEVVSFFYTYLTRQGSDSEAEIYVHTREDFADKIQTPLQIAFSIAFGVPKEIRLKMIDDLKEMDYISILALLSSGEALAEFIKPYLDEAKFHYDESTLAEECESIQKLIGTNLPLISQFLELFVYEENDFATNMIRTFMVHFPEVQYPLFLDYLANNKQQK